MLRQIKPLTSLRFFASLAVLLHHANDYAPLGWPPHVIQTLPVAVDFFFILSGFILAQGYLARFDKSMQATASFLLARFARLYPAHLFVLCLFVLYVAAGYLAGLPYNGDRFAISALAYHALLLNAWGADDHLTWNYPDWSISAEWAAYLLFPALALGLNRISPWAALMSLCVLLISFVPYDAQFQVINRSLNFSMLRIWPEFLMGMLACRSMPIWQGVAHLANPVFAICAVLVVWLTATSQAASWIVLTFAVMIPAASQLDGWLAKALSRSFLVRLGEESYALYLIHALVLSVLFSAFKLSSIARFYPGHVVALSMALIVSMLAAALIHRFVELPARDRLRGLRGRSAPMAKA